jgi:hypothetical protein
MREPGVYERAGMLPPEWLDLAEKELGTRKRRAKKD